MRKIQVCIIDFENCGILFEGVCYNILNQKHLLDTLVVLKSITK